MSFWGRRRFGLCYVANALTMKSATRKTQKETKPPKIKTSIKAGNEVAPPKTELTLHDNKTKWTY